MNLFHSSHPARIFFFSGLVTIVALLYSFTSLGPSAAFVVAVLIVVEVTFSFDNAIINARILQHMSRFWQQMFLTIGILIAVFGMRLVFPILVVMATAALSWGDVINLALNQPDLYSLELEKAHPTISSFGGLFLLMLALHFFFDASRTVRWLTLPEAVMQRAHYWWAPGVTAIFILLIVVLLPIHGDKVTVLLAGLAGIATYSIIHWLITVMERRQKKNEKNSLGGPMIKTGLAGFTSFMYLEILDASFSFDGVIGAFAITKDVVLIAIGLGVGAVWVRSLTIYMVRKKVLHAFRFLEHGAHYTILLLSIFFLSSLVVDLPEVVAGGIGITIIGLSIISSRRRHETAS